MIHQLQVSYLIEQDRILVRLNSHGGEELRLWLTRRLLKNLLPHLVELATRLDQQPAQPASHDGADPQALNEFKKQESLQQADFSTPFNNEAAVLPMGDEPLLATSVHITRHEDGQLKLAFEEGLPGVQKLRNFEVTLGTDLLHALMHLLDKALQHADWSISSGEPSDEHDASLLDAFANASPPKYLN